MPPESIDFFARHLQDLQQAPLPGLDVHTRVLFPYRQDLINRYPDIRYRPAAVLVLVYPGAKEWESVLIKRYVYDGVHSGQMAFPGGKTDPGDRDAVDTALREAYEEVNIRPEEVHVIRSLTPIKIPVSRFEVTPVWGYSHRRPDFRPQPGEVAQIVTIPWRYLMEAPWQMEERLYEDRVYPVYYLPWKGEKIWGATAMVIAELREIWEKVKRDR